MKSDYTKTIPLGVLLISAFYIFGALMLLVSILTNPVGTSQAIAAAHGLSPILGVEILIFVAGFALILAFGLISLSKWGYILGLTYSLYLAGVSIVMGGLRFLETGQPGLQIYFGNFLWSMIVIVYLVSVRRRFFSI